MSNGNNELIKQLRDAIAQGASVDEKTRDILLLSAVADIYESQKEMRAELTTNYERLREETRPAVQFAKIGSWIGGVISVALVGFLFAIFTGQVEIIFK